MKAKLVTRRHTCGGKQQASMMTIDNNRSRRAGLLGWQSAVRRASCSAFAGRPGRPPHLWEELEGQAPVVEHLLQRQDAHVGSQAGDEVDGDQAAGDGRQRPIPVGGIAAGRRGRRRAMLMKPVSGREQPAGAAGRHGCGRSGGLLEAPLAGRNCAAHRSCTPRTSP